MCARFTVLSDTPIAAAIAGWAIPLSRNNTIWMRWRCAAGIFQRNAVFSRRTSALLHLTICFPRIRWRKRITPRARKIAPDYRPRIPIQAVMEAVLGVANGAACELEGLPSAFAGLLPNCALSGLFAERKSKFQSDQPEDGQSIETAECRLRNWRGRRAGRHGARL